MVKLECCRNNRRSEGSFADIAPVLCQATLLKVHFSKLYELHLLDKKSMVTARGEVMCVLRVHTSRTK